MTDLIGSEKMHLAAFWQIRGILREERFKCGSQFQHGDPETHRPASVAA